MQLQKIVDAIQPLVSDGEVVELHELAAATVFSHLIEPGDRFLGALVAEIGFVALLETIRESPDTAVSVLGSDPTNSIAEQFGSSFPALWQNAQERWLPRLLQDEVLASLSLAVDLGLTIVGEGNQQYPRGLDDLSFGKPPILWVKGEPSLFTTELPVAIVGTRNATRYGAEVAADLAQVAAQHGLVTVSGGAFGIDAVVHQATLNNRGGTVAFLAGGLGNLYPKGNLALLKRIAQTGALVAEQPPAVTPAKWRFLMRNRLIAAISNATVVVQAGKTSGALSTANHAISLERPVAIVPGPIDSPHSIGGHDLLNNHPDQVSLLARPAELLSLVGFEHPAYEMLVAGTSLSTLEKRALDSFASGPLESWEVQRLAGLTVKETQIALGGLELSNLITRVGARYVRTTT